MVELDPFTEGQTEFRSLKHLTSIIKHIKQKKNKGRVVETFSTMIIRMDLLIDGMSKIGGVPIELSGVQSYVLDPDEQTLAKIER